MDKEEKELAKYLREQTGFINFEENFDIWFNFVRHLSHNLRDYRQHEKRLLWQAIIRQKCIKVADLPLLPEIQYIVGEHLRQLEQAKHWQLFSHTLHHIKYLPVLAGIKKHKQFSTFYNARVGMARGDYHDIWFTVGLVNDLIDLNIRGEYQNNPDVQHARTFLQRTIDLPHHARRKFRTLGLQPGEKVLLYCTCPDDLDSGDYSLRQWLAMQERCVIHQSDDPKEDEEELEDVEADY
ncbi:hypothetical protein QOT17_005876 [Balamuthia mandrillaris]